jgi:hypothetical protein
MQNVFDAGALAVHQTMYQAWVLPELFPEAPQPRLSNWDPEDLAAYCGGVYAK